MTVFFDYDGFVEPGAQLSGTRRKVFGLLPGRAEKHAVIVKMSRERFVSALLSEHLLFSPEKIVDEVTVYLERRRMLIEKLTAKVLKDFQLHLR